MTLIRWQIWLDTGGTFTDCIAIAPGDQLRRLKVLSSSVLRSRVIKSYQNRLLIDLPFVVTKNFLNGFYIRSGKEIRTALSFDARTSEISLDASFKSKNSIETVEIYTEEEVPVFAARLLTETGLDEEFPLIEMKLGSTRGTNALLERKGARTAFLVTKGFKDLLAIGNQQRKDLFALDVLKEEPLYKLSVEVTERIEADGSVLDTLEPAEIKRIVSLLKGKRIDSVAIALLNSYKNSSHEMKLHDALYMAGFRHISCSSRLSQQIKILTRAETSLVNAYLDPVIHQYISNIRRGLASSSIKVMSSAGGLLEAGDFNAKDSLLSGPAGGVIGALAKAKLSGIDRIITFDMGGTSTDVSRCNGRPDYRFDCHVGNLKIFTPSLAIETIAAGGGSVCQCNDRKLTVGPHSAGASPGPACYGAGGPLTITDVNLLLGRLDEDNFSIPLRVDMAVKALQPLIKQLRSGTGTSVKPEDLLASFVEIANEKMAEAIRKISIQKGHDPADYTLLCFGGAGGQHACAIAGLLNIQHIVVPYDAGLLSAYGIGNAAPESVKEKLFLKDLDAVLPHLEEEYEYLFEEARRELTKMEVDDKIPLQGRRLIFIRLKGQETSLEIEFTTGSELKAAFILHYRKVYGHWIENREIEVESIRLILSAIPIAKGIISDTTPKYSPDPVKEKKIFVSGYWRKCPVMQWEKLSAGAHIDGPALVVSDNSTLFVDDGWHFFLDRNENAHVRKSGGPVALSKKPMEAELELFTNRFTAIAEDMGTLLQRTSFSVNVKERLDFSCAVLDNRGMLVVNAPHIPVHLGSMGVCVRNVMKKISMEEGDVIITNHPGNGGSHLPDITLIKPVFVREQLIGFVANRAHHAEIGGKSPGSMPADATCLEEEGVVISPAYLVRKGIAQWENIRTILTDAPYPTRCIEENLADLNGALASLEQGAEEIKNLCSKFSTAQVQFFMRSVTRHSARLMKIKSETLKGSYEAKELLDDGAVLRVRISREKKRLKIDFSGSAPLRKNNLNATPAIVNSVVVYVLRLLVGQPVPLNEGLLQDVRIVLPRGMLNPLFSPDNKKSPAVVGGNTEISQRLTDTLLKALKLSACSQGTMNNFLFGNERFGYYETICGGVGATKGHHGAHAVHQHMTNTRITDPEILELRYPVRLEKFEIRKNSGGKGKWNGGDGIVRQLYFKESLDINILSQHRTVPPFGMSGGMPGKTGEQYILRSGGGKEKLAGVDGAKVHAGDRVVIKTPGGGGWGKKKRAT